MLTFLLGILGSFAITVVLAAATRRFALRKKIVDTPDTKRKKHAGPVALLGGVPIFVALVLGVIFLVYFLPGIGFSLLIRQIEALAISLVILVILGIVDDIRELSFAVRFPILCVAFAIVAYTSPLTKITNPFGGYLAVSTLLGSLGVFAWLMLSSLSIKIIDGVDGLAAGVGCVANIIISALCFSAKFYQPNVGAIAALFSVILLAFLCFNLPPATLFLGESGSLVVGLMVGALSIMAGSKLATVLMVMLVPILDMFRVMMARFRAGKPVFLGDRRHLHFLLIDSKWDAWQVLGLFCGTTLLLGSVSLTLESYQKIIALFLVVAAFIFLVSRGRLRRV